MKNYFFALCLVFSACAQIADTTSQNSSNNECVARSTKVLKGQIKYLEGMILKVPSCKTYYSADFDFKTEKAIGKVIDQIDLKTRTTPQYIDITFRGYLNWKGKLIVKSVEIAEVSDSVIF